jgi:NADH-quinone oxidoreductase subunit G
MSNLKKISIDGIEVEVDGAMTIIQAAEVAGIEIPRFCYHERLSIAGNCRMCLVEVVGGPPKPAASCAMQVRDLRPGPNGEAPVVKTTSPMVKKAREGVMEFLLINHPLDCPICDQGGDGLWRGLLAVSGTEAGERGPEPWPAGRDEDDALHQLHPLRAVHDRSGRDHPDGPDRARRRQRDHQLSQYDAGFEPAGQHHRPLPRWRLDIKALRLHRPTKTETVDVMDALGSNIRVDTKGREVMRILPRNHDGVNEEWISDKTRFVWDGLRRQRLDTPYVREGGKLRKATWGEALAAAAAAMKGKKVAALVGDLAPVEAVYSLKQLIEGAGGHVECRTDGAKLPAGNRSASVGTAAIEDIDSAKSILIVGSNPRVEAAVLNARIRKAWSLGATVALIGEAVDLTFDYHHAGTDRAALAALVAEAKKAGPDGKAGVVIVGQGALNEADGEAVLGQVMALCEATGAKLLVLHTAASRVGAMDVGAVTEGGLAAATDGAEVIYNLGADEVEIAAGPFVIYQGSHGDRGASRADVILPGAAWTEENGLFVNTEGRPQLALRAGFAPGEAKENWAILRALSAELGATLPWDSLAALRSALIKAHPHLGRIDEVAENPWQALPVKAMGKATFRNATRDFYLTNPVARASSVMAELSAMAKARAAAPLAAE